MKLTPTGNLVLENDYNARRRFFITDDRISYKTIDFFKTSLIGIRN